MNKLAGRGRGHPRGFVAVWTLIFTGQGHCGSPSERDTKTVNRCLWRGAAEVWDLIAAWHEGPPGRRSSLLHAAVTRYKQ